MISKAKHGQSDVELWGEISEESRKIISDDILRTLIRGAVKQEDPKPKLPVTDDDEEDSFPLLNFKVKQNEYVLHTIRLNEHARRVQELIEGLSPGKTEFEICPPLPDIPLDIASVHGRLKDDEKKSTFNFEFGQGPELPVLDTDNINLMLQKSVLLTLAETGFEKAKKSAVHVLIDIVRDILTKISRMLHMFSQHDIMRDRTTYSDTLEKVLQLLGLSGIKELHEFYVQNVIGKRDAAVKRSLRLVNHYNSMVNKMKEQAAIEADEANIPELNLSINSGEDSLENLDLGFLGFQVLLDLEAENQMNNSSDSKSVVANGNPDKRIFKKRISSGSLQGKRKKPRTDP